MYLFILFLVFLLGTGLHIYFLQFNQVLKVADSFAYLQMADSFKHFSLDWFGTWWFGFLYSLPIWILNFILDFFWFNTTDNLFLSAQIINILLFGISWVLIYFIWKLYLNRNYNLLLLILFFISPILINYNINILSENIYIPLFLVLVLVLNRLISLLTNNNLVNLNWINFKVIDEESVSKTLVFTSLILALLYYTRWEAFIYIWSIFIIFFILLVCKHISFIKFLKYNFIFVILFAIFISPYIYYLHTITWEWWLTNKWASNLRQAQMRWVEEMDDSWFEKAVWELTQDKHHFIHWFAWWLKYDKPSSTGSILTYINEDKKEFLNRFLSNQKKLYFENIPKILIWESLKTYDDPNFYFYKNKFYLFFLLIPLFFFLYGILALIFNKKAWNDERKNFIIISFSTFSIASTFFTLFFVLDRYFIVFLPLALVAMCYWIQSFLSNFDKQSEVFRVFKYIIFLFIFISIFILWDLNYLTFSKFDDQKYLLKKEAGLLLKEKFIYEDDNGKKFISKWEEKSRNINTSSLAIMERFPIFTYYVWSRQRWLTPYTDKLEDLVEYARYNKIDYLVVDTMDFEKYRPWLSFLLDYEKPHKWLEFIRVFSKPWQMVIIYKIRSKLGNFFKK